MSNPSAAPSVVPPSLGERLQVITESLAAARTQEDVFRVVLTPALQALDAVAGAVLLVNETGERLEIVARQEYEEGAQTLWQDGPIDDNVPAGDALGRHAPLFFENQGDLTRAYPRLEARTGGVAAAATAVLPMFLDEQPLGALILDLKGPHEFTPEETRFLRTLAAQCALAVGRVKLTRDLQRQVGELARLRRLVEESQDSIGLADLSGQVQFVNAAGRHLVGLENVEAVRRTRIADYFVEEDRARIVNELLPHILARGSWSGDMRFRHFQTGEPIDVHWNSFQITDDQTGEPLALATVTRDIRERKAAERALQNLNRTLEAQVAARTSDLDAARRTAEVLAYLGDALQTAASPDEVARLSLERLGPALEANGMNIVRLEGEHIQATTFWGDVPERIQTFMTRPDLRLADTPNLLHVARTRQALYFDDYHATAGPVESFPSLSGAAEPIQTPGGMLVGFMVAWRPVKLGAWREGQRDLLRRAAATLGLALERAANAAQLDARNRALEAFEEWSRDLTLDAEPYALVRRAQDLLHTLLPVDAALYYEREGECWYVRSMRGEFGSEGLRQAHEAGLVHAETDNLRLPSETGEPYYQDVYDPATDQLTDHMTHVSATAMLPLKTGRGVRGILGLAKFGRSGWSTTERTTFETVRRSLELSLDRADQVAQLAQERAALAAANEELEAFTYSVSHDLRTPVRHVMSFNDLLRRQLGEGLDAKATRYLTVVGEAAGRMNTLIDAMLDLSRTSRLPLRLGPVDLGELVQTVRTELEADVLERQVEWQVSPLPLVTADHDTLRQAVVNLLENALKYTRTRGVARIEVGAEERPGEWVIRVRDNGVGFDPQYGNKLFGVFQRLHVVKDFEGTGVGLANVRRIITRHGGRVFAEGQPGEGATFGFTLPRA